MLPHRDHRGLRLALEPDRLTANPDEAVAKRANLANLRDLRLKRARSEPKTALAVHRLPVASPGASQVATAQIMKMSSAIVTIDQTGDT